MISQTKPVVILPPEHDLEQINKKPDFIYLMEDSIEESLKEWCQKGTELLEKGDFINSAKDLS